MQLTKGIQCPWLPKAIYDRQKSSLSSFLYSTHTLGSGQQKGIKKRRKKEGGLEKKLVEVGGLRLMAGVIYIVPHSLSPMPHHNIE